MLYKISHLKQSPQKEKKISEDCVLMTDTDQTLETLCDAARKEAWPGTQTQTQTQTLTFSSART
jgi:hypothetical protein